MRPVKTSHMKGSDGALTYSKLSMRSRNSPQRDILDAHVPGLMDMMSLCSPVTGRMARHSMSTSPCPWPYMDMTSLWSPVTDKVARHPISANHGEHPQNFSKVGSNMIIG